MRERLTALVADTTARVVLGDRCKDRDLFLRALDSALELSGGFNPADLWPSSWLISRLSSAVRRAEQSRDTVFGILDGIIKEHLERMDSGAGAGEAEDLLDILLKIQKDGGLPIPLDMEVIKAVIFDIFGAGSETSSTALEWVVAELIRNPKAMRRATGRYEERSRRTGQCTSTRSGSSGTYTSSYGRRSGCTRPCHCCSRRSPRSRAAC